MAIPYGMQDFPMTGKLDMRTDSMDVQPPNLITLENGFVSAPGRFNKRPSVQAIGANTYRNVGNPGYYATDAANSTGTLPSSKTPVVVAYKNQLVSMHNNRVMVHPTGDSADAPVFVGRHFPFPMERGPAGLGSVHNISGQPTQPLTVTGVVQVGNYACSVAIGGSVNRYLYLNVFDLRDGSQIIRDWFIATTLSGTYKSGGVMLAGSSTHIMVSHPSGLTTVLLYSIPVSSFASGTPTISATNTITNVYGGIDAGFDLYGTGDGTSFPFHFAYYDSVQGKLCMRRYAANGTADAVWLSGAVSSPLTAGPRIRTVRITGTGYYLVTNTQGANQLRLWGANDSLTADLFVPAAIMATFTGTNTLTGSDLAIGVETIGASTTAVRVWASGYSVSAFQNNTASDVFNTSTGVQINANNYKIVFNKRLRSRGVVINGLSCVVLLDDPLSASSINFYPRTMSIVAWEAPNTSGGGTLLASTPWTIGRYALHPIVANDMGDRVGYDVYTQGTKTHFLWTYITPTIDDSGARHTSHLYIDASETNPLAYQVLETGDYLYLCGAAPAYFDGEKVLELGFDNYPMIRFAAAAAGGSLPVATLNFTFIWEYTDKYGRVHRSAPAEPASVTTSGGNLSADLYINPLVTSRQDLGVLGIHPYSVRINIYRTTASDANTYYLCKVINNDASTVTTIVNLTASDASITSSETLYTTGGVLDNDVWPSMGSMCAFQNRIIGVDTERNTVLYTKSSTDAEPPELSLFNEIPIVGTGMPLTLIRSVEQLLVAFGQRSVYITTGAVSNDLGVGGQFQEWQPVTQNLGCAVPRASAQTSEGVWFVSNQGVQLFSGGQVQPVGLPVQPYNSNTWYGAGAVETHNRKHIMFANYDSTNSVSRLLVYDALNQTWAVWKMGFSPANTFVVTSICQPSGATVPYYGIYRSGLAPRVATESTSDYRDYNGATYAVIHMTVRTGWINFGSNQSLLRVRRLVTMLDSLLTNPSASAWIVINVYRDFDDSLYDTTSYALTSSIATYPKPGQFRTRLKNQKVQTISVEIRVEADVDYYSAAATISGLSLEIGQRGGAARLPTTKTANV